MIYVIKSRPRREPAGAVFIPVQLFSNWKIMSPPISSKQ